MQLTDDKTVAIIHIVASNRSAFQGVLSDKRPEVFVFEPGVQTKAAIELALQKFSKNFSLSTFEVLAPMSMSMNSRLVFLAALTVGSAFATYTYDYSARLRELSLSS